MALTLGSGCQSAEDKAFFATLDLFFAQTGEWVCSGSGTLSIGGSPVADGHSLILACGSEADQIFWVRNGVVYAVNDEARARWSEMPVAPDTVTEYDILLAENT